ncbi:MAG: beta-N-acetylhexosaminidase [Candidatus Aureabacteria bacterium]|nr:beta-N-acetylhexosaminidase [Candidatus Auribacterota bacterium]
MNFDPGELCLFGFEGVGPDAALERRIVRERIGGVILFGRNILGRDQTRELCRGLQAIRRSVSDLPLLIAVDQEGGAVARFREGFTIFPGNLALGAGGGEGTAYRQGRVTGAELRDVGVNLNLAPVLDLRHPDGFPGAGIRSLGSDPGTVAALGMALIRGIQDEGVAATAKHFPGKWRAAVDSHLDLPVIAAPESELRGRDLPPFAAACSAAVAAVMTSHAVYPALDPGGFPGTLSRRLLTDLLRADLGYRGVLITDDLGMGAIRKRMSAGEAAVGALQAGADLILVCHSPGEREEAFAHLARAVSSGGPAAARGEESAARLRVLRERLKCVRSPRAGAGVDGKSLSEEIARRAIAIPRNRRRLIPLSFSRPLVLLWFQDVGAEDRRAPIWELAPYLIERGFSVRTLRFPGNPAPGEIGGVLESIRGEERPVAASFDAFRDPGQTALLRAVFARRPDSVLIPLKDPRDAELFPEADAVITAYSFVPSSLAALADTLSGSFSPPRLDNEKI